MYLPGKRKDNCLAETAEYHKSVPFVLEFGGLTTRAGMSVLHASCGDFFNILLTFLGYAGYETPTVQIPTVKLLEKFKRKR